jgi:LPS-assembly lipoprotein
MRIKKKSSVVLFKAVLVVLLLALVTACGFKLRGAVSLPEGMQKIFIEGSSHSDLVKDLKSMLDYSQVELVNKINDADAVLDVSDETIKKRTISVGSRGRTRESELQYTVVYKIKNKAGEIIVPNETLFLVRDFIDDEDDVIGRLNEAELIERELKRDAAQQILRRLQTLEPIVAAE